MKRHLHKNIDVRKGSLISLIFLILLLISTSLLAETANQRTAFSITSRSTNYMDIEFTIPAFEIKQEQQMGNSYHKILMDNAAYLTEEGMPELPTLSTIIAIPEHGSVYAELLDSQTRVLSNITPFPVQKEQTKSDDFIINTDYYSGSKSVDTKVLQISDPQILRDFRIINLQIEPFVWDATAKDMVVYDELTLRLHFSDEPGINELSSPLSAPLHISSAFDQIYQSQILNYDDYRDEIIADAPPKILMLHGASSDQFLLQLIDDFAFWKKQKGADVTVLSTAETGSTNNDIKNYLQGLYDNPATRFDYLVIIGDVTGAFAVPGWFNSYGFGDYPYQMLAGNDPLGDVFIGRISAENYMQLYVILSKVYAYEKNIDVQNADHLNNMLLVADTAVSGVSIVNLSYYIKEISELINPDYSYNMITKDHPTPYEINNGINQGIGIFNFRGLGGMSGWAPIESNIYNNRLFHSVIITCNTGDYDMTATTEQLIRLGTAAQPKGAVTSIGMSGNETATMPNNALCGGIHSGIFIDDMRTMGEALLFSKLNFYRLYSVSNLEMYHHFTQWCNLMGDPTMEIYVTIPKTFSIDAPETVPSGVNSLDFTVVDQYGFPVSQATVTVTKVQDSVRTIIGRGYSDESGMIYLPLNEEVTSSSLIVTVSKHDFKPLQQTITVEDGSLLASAPMIDDDLNGLSDGNNNSIANSGESLEVLFALRNTSDDLIEGISGHITSNSPYVTIVDSLLNFADIPAGANSFCTNPVIMQISAETPNNSLLRFTMHLTDAESNQYTIADYLSVTDAELSYVSHTIVDGEDSILDPGETANLNLTLLNIGEREVEDLIGELFTDNDLVTVVDSLGSFGSINIDAEGNTTADNFILQGRDELLPGMIIPMRLKLSNPSGFLQWLPFSITIGTVTVNDPLGPDRYGYVIYDDGDTGYDECPVYDWIEIAPAAGGDGVLLNINDPEIPTEGDGTEATSLAWVDLPFTFGFYGQAYQNITINSNGTVTFGHTDNHEFRNYKIPGPMGPAPMVAAFWDDLATSPNSQVCTLFDEENHTFIIEWYNMMNGYDNSYLETFQVILYDPAYYPTSFGDGAIKIQYKIFNNVNSGATYQNHGSFCTIGIESEDHHDGLEYTFMNTYPTAASPLGHERAIYITKRPEFYYNPTLVIGDIMLNDSNNIAEPGERIELGVHLENLGDLPAQDIQATLRIQDPYVTMINSSSTYHPIYGHSDGVNLDPFIFTISSSCPIDHEINLTLDVTGRNRSWTHDFALRVKQPGLIYDSFYLNDAAGNGNGVVDPGESFTLILNVANHSEVAALDLIGELTSTDANITINNPLITIPVLEANKSTQFIFDASLSSSAQIYNSIPLEFSLSSSNAPSFNTEISLGCGSMGMFSDLEESDGGLESINGWQWGSSSYINAHSGSRVWGTALNGDYANGANYILISDPIFIGTGASLTFWHQLFCQENFDGGNVSISTNDGASWNLIYPSSGSPYSGTIYSINEPGFASDIANWTEVSFDLSDFANNEIRIRWHFTSDGVTTNLGWYIDDIFVTGYTTMAGHIGGNVSLSDGGDPSLATISVDLENTTVITNPDSLGAYDIYLPIGNYSLTAAMPYHVSQNSPEFVIDEETYDFVYDFDLIGLAAVSAFSIDHEEYEHSATLLWEPPIDPAFPVLAYKVYRKTGPGVVEEIAELIGTTLTEDELPNGNYYYHVRPLYEVGEGAPSDTLELLITDQPTSDEDQISTLVNVLYPNSPNPFNPSTTISFDLVKPSHAQLKIYNLKGQLINTLIDQDMAVGRHRLVWDGRDSNHRPVASGVYLYRLTTEDFVKTRKMLLLK